MSAVTKRPQPQYTRLPRRLPSAVLLFLAEGDHGLQLGRAVGWHVRCQDL